VEDLSAGTVEDLSAGIVEDWVLEGRACKNHDRPTGPTTTGGNGTTGIDKAIDVMFIRLFLDGIRFKSNTWFGY
jgi:hypothetical protein